MKPSYIPSAPALAIAAAACFNANPADAVTQPPKTTIETAFDGIEKDHFMPYVIDVEVPSYRSEHGGRYGEPITPADSIVAAIPFVNKDGAQGVAINAPLVDSQDPERAEFVSGYELSVKEVRTFESVEALFGDNSSVKPIDARSVVRNAPSVSQTIDKKTGKIDGQLRMGNGLASMQIGEADAFAKVGDKYLELRIADTQDRLEFTSEEDAKTFSKALLTGEMIEVYSLSNHTEEPKVIRDVVRGNMDLTAVLDSQDLTTLPDIAAPKDDAVSMSFKNNGVVDYDQAIALGGMKCNAGIIPTNETLNHYVMQGAENIHQQFVGAIGWMDDDATVHLVQGDGLHYQKQPDGTLKVDLSRSLTSNSSACAGSISRTEPGSTAPAFVPQEFAVVAPTVSKGTSLTDCFCGKSDGTPNITNGKTPIFPIISRHDDEYKHETPPPIAPIPVPTSGLLLGSALLGGFAVSRRRQRKLA